ncbi:T9SS type A sorting domain-containing protein [Flavobacteriaceae bacterium]|nr:T9SS type A sorting domain-containing protein [Flavobacteriaceae bacterium]
MKNVTLLKIASLFIFLLTAQFSFGQNCSDYPDWYQTTWYNSDVVHYNGKLYSPCYSSTVADLTDASNRTETTDSCLTFWGFVADCTSTPTETIAIQDFDGATPDWSYTQTFSPTSSVNLFFEDLTGENDEDTTGSASGINWALSGGGGNNSEVYVHNGDHVHMSKNDGTIAVWQTTDNIDITSTANLNFTVKVKKTKNLDSDDYVRLLYSKNGGALIEIATYYNDINDDTIIGGDINSLTGNTLIGNPGDTIKLFMHVRNDSNSEQFEWEEIKLTGNVIDGTINSLGTNTTNAWGNKGYLDEAEITFNTVDLSNHDNLTFSFDYFIDSTNEPSGEYEDNFVYDIYYNGSVTASLTEELIVNGGATDTWTSKSISVPDGTTSIKVIFNYDVTSAFDEHLGLDNLKVTGIIKLPGCATNLSPTNTATNVSVTPQLSWSAPANGGPVEIYKIYYGTDSSTSTYFGETANTSVTLPTLVNNTQYFWKVVPTNARGGASGCSAISFTTVPLAPGCASYTSPTDGAIDISLTPELSWSATTGATGYKVYYSSDSSNLGDPITLGEVTSYQLPQLGYETQYFWKVVPTNAGGDASGCSVISFTTLKNPAGSVFITGNTVTVSKNAYLYLEKDFTNTGGSVTLNSDSNEFASIIVEGTATGDITYNKYVNQLYYQGWDLVGSPVINQSISGFVSTNDDPLAVDPTGPTYYAIGTHDAATNNFTNYTGATVGGAGNFIPAKGYQMATDSGATMAFTGEVATTTQTVNVQNQNGANGGVGVRWNLVSNPFPSYIKGNNLADDTHNFLKVNADAGIIDNQSAFLAAYGWKADGSGYVAYNYITGSTGDLTPLLIAPGQGFFVAANQSTQQALIFTPQMRTVAGGDDFINGAPILLNYNFNLKLFHGNSEKAETKYFFKEGLTLGLDSGYDAGALDQLTPLSSRLPEADTGVNFQINAMSLESAYNQSVPLVINQEQGQSFRISISNNTLPEDINVYLEDVLNGTLTSLKEQDFELSAQEDLSDAGRFYIHFTTQSLAIDEVLNPNNINVYKLNTEAYITIKGLTPEMGKTSATLYNMLGMKVRQKALNTSQDTQHISTQGLAGGVYIIKLNAGDVSFSKKVIIQ